MRQVWREGVMSGSSQMTRVITREVLKFISEKSSSNKSSSINHLSTIWENVHKEFELFNVNEYLHHVVSYYSKIIVNRFGRDNLHHPQEEKLDLPGEELIQPISELLDHLITSECGENIAQEALVEVGILQYLEKAREEEDSLKRNRTTSTTTENTLLGSKKRSFSEIFGRDVQLLLDWTVFSLTFFGQHFNIW